jgi:hypothetical protein
MSFFIYIEVDYYENVCISADMQINQKLYSFWSICISAEIQIFSQ